MYVHEGNANGQGARNNANSSRLFRSDDVATGAPVFTDMSSADPAQPGFAFRGLCDPQCWYDIFVYTPPGYPDMVYVGGDYYYGETIANKMGVILSQDAGVSGTDMTFDGTDMLHPNGIHPDQHSLVTIPGQAAAVHRDGRRRRHPLERRARRPLVLVRRPESRPRRTRCGSHAASSCCRRSRRGSTA